MRGPAAGRRVWVDGAEVAADEAVLSIDDPTVLSGLGLFETLALRDGRLLDLDEHLERLAHGVARLDLPLPPLEELRNTALVAAAAERAAAAWLKILLSGGGRWIVFTGPLEPDPAGEPLTAALLPWRRPSSGPLIGVKSLCYAANAAGLAEARRRGGDEGLWLNERGSLVEGCRSNLFLVRGRALFTPALREGPLAGIVRRLSIEAARRLGLDVHEGRVRLDGLRRAREAFVTSSLGGVRPLVAVDGRAIGSGAPGTTTRAIADTVDRLRAGA